MQKSNFSPDPGTYAPEYNIPKKRLVSGAPFLSEVQRDKRPKRRPPGPAFYNPKTGSKKQSYLNNPEKIWV